jgi:type VI secretion system protein ImpC
MSKSWNLRMGGIHLGTDAAPGPATPADDTPFRILVLGDFSGRGSRGDRAASLTDRKPLALDRDNFDDVMAKLRVEVQAPLAADAAGRVAIRVADLDDFHPDRLFDRLEVFESLRGLRRRLGNSSSFAAAAEEVRAWAKVPAAAPPPPPAAPPDDPAALLEEMLGLPPTPRQEYPIIGDFNAFLHSVVGPHLVAAADPQKGQLEAAVDEAVGGTMRALLHHPAFQEIEAAWRALFLLVRRLPTDETLKIHLLDLTRAELVADLTASDDLRTSRLYKLLVEQTVGTPGGKPWSVLCGHYTFAPTLGDAALLQRLALLAQVAGAPFVAGAHSRVFNCPSLGTAPDPDDWTAKPEPGIALAWNTLRQFPEARYLALAAPRFLLRYPYGPATNPTERFTFKELADTPGHEEFLWGNAAVAVATLLGEAFHTSGWSMRLGQVRELDGLPAVSYSDGDEQRLKPCAEALLNERGLAKLLDEGILPLLSVAESDRARVARFQSFASPPTALAGRWESR